MPKIDGPEGFAKGLSVDTLPKGDSVAGFPKGDSPAAFAKGDSVAGLDAAKLENPPAFANEPNPPPAAALGVPKGSGLPGVDGCPKLGAALAPKPDWPNWGVARPRALGVPNEGLIWDGDPMMGHWEPMVFQRQVVGYLELRGCQTLGQQKACQTVTTPLPKGCQRPTAQMQAARTQVALWAVLVLLLVIAVAVAVSVVAGLPRPDHGRAVSGE